MEWFVFQSFANVSCRLFQTNIELINNRAIHCDYQFDCEGMSCRSRWSNGSPGNFFSAVSQCTAAVRSQFNTKLVCVQYFVWMILFDNFLRHWNEISSRLFNFFQIFNHPLRHQLRDLLLQIPWRYLDFDDQPLEAWKSCKFSSWAFWKLHRRKSISCPDRFLYCACSNRSYTYLSIISIFCCCVSSTSIYFWKRAMDCGSGTRRKRRLIVDHFPFRLPVDGLILSKNSTTRFIESSEKWLCSL